MNYNYLGKTNIRVSELCLGTMTFGGQTSAEEATRIIHAALEHGINFFDTANVYEGGRSESIIGQALVGRRHEVVLATKFGFAEFDPPNHQGISKTNIMLALENSLQRLQTDYIDLYYLHWPRQGMQLESLLSALDELQRQGKIRAVAVSNFPAWLLCRALWLSEIKNLTAFVALQVPYNLIERGIEVEVVPLCGAENVALVPYRPLAIGVLTGKHLKEIEKSSRGSSDARVGAWNQSYQEAIFRLASIAHARWHCSPAQLAIAWVRDHPVVTSTLVGISHTHQLQETFALSDWHLTPTEREEIGNLFPTAVWEESGGSYPEWRRSLDIVRKGVI
jgi:aryl-alcohol dehydrogenase-like predicted oxidoreductase